MKTEYITSTLAYEKVYITERYDLFSFMNGNRKVDEQHVNDLVESMTKKDLDIPIVVNDRNEIVDGQHRFIAKMKMGKPISYIIRNNVDLEDVRTLNISQQSWGNTDYMQSYIDQGKKDYEIYKFYKERFKLTHASTLQILAGPAYYTKTRDCREKFKSGEIIITDLGKARQIFDWLDRISEVFRHGRKRSFVAAFLHCIKNVEKFDPEQFISKLEVVPTKMIPCANMGEYLLVMEGVYNWKVRKKVPLRQF